MRRCSRVCDGCTARIWFGTGPRWVMRNMQSEQPAVIKVPAPVRAIVQGDQLNKEVIIISSPIKLGRGGRARLARLAINHQAAISGSIICMPRARSMVRLCVRSQLVLARQNRADEVNPWAIMRISAPVNPQGVWIRIPPTTNPIWLTDEQAISDFRSVWRMQMEPVIITPQRARMMKGQLSSLVRGSRVTKIRIMPQPPNFSSTAARIIDPAMGASTWAFGSQR